MPARSNESDARGTDGLAGMDGVDDLVVRDRAPEVSEQIGQNRSLLGAMQLERTLCPYDLERTEDAELHARMRRRTGGQPGGPSRSGTRPRTIQPVDGR